MAATVAEASLPPAGVIEAARDLLADLNQFLWAARRPSELLDAKKEIERLRSQLCAIDAELVVEVDATHAAKAEGWGSAGMYLTAITGGRQGSGQSVLRVATDLTGDRRLTLKTLRQGRISQAHAEVIVAAIDRLPVKRSLREAAERELIKAAQTLNATDLAAMARPLIETLDPDGSDRREEKALARDERAAHLGRHLSITDDGIGGVRIKGRGTTEDAAIIKAALFPLTTPMPGCPAGHIAGCDDSGKDPRDHSTRMWDALVGACQKVLDTEIGPESHGTKPRVSLTMGYAELVQRIGAGMLDTGQHLSASAVRRVACDADITPVILGTRSQILDVGRNQRLVTPGIWQALVVRDGGCTFPGCTRPPVACDAHHIRHWLDGGPTNLTNLALLCRAHHMMIHDTPWEIRLNKDDQRPEFLPPARLDPDRQPIRQRQPRR